MIHNLNDIVSEEFYKHRVLDEDMFGNIDCACGFHFYENIKYPIATQEYKAHLIEKICNRIEEALL